jgi:hypothetical protein
MSWTRRRLQTVTTWVVVVAWVVFYAVALATADTLPPPETAVVQLVIPPLLWVVAARLCYATGGPRLAPACPRWTRRDGCSRPPWRRYPNAGVSGVGR